MKPAPIFLAAFLPQFVQPGSPQAPQYLILGLTVLAMVGWSQSALRPADASLRSVMATPVASPRQGNRVFGSLFIGAGLALASAKAAEASMRSMLTSARLQR